jgi:LPXTG-motif cell wall-anchored protein
MYNLLASFIVVIPATRSVLNLSEQKYYITWIGLLIALAVGVGSFLIVKNKKNIVHED